MIEIRKPKNKTLIREWREPYRVCPTPGKPMCYTILFPSSYKTALGMWDVLCEGVPEEVAALVLMGIQAAQERLADDPGALDRLLSMDARAAFISTGADVWGSRNTTWWWDKVDEQKIREARGCEFMEPAPERLFEMQATSLRVPASEYRKCADLGPIEREMGEEVPVFRKASRAA